MGGLKSLHFNPNPAHRTRYDALFSENRRLHDFFGRSDPVMRNLRAWAG